ncbi:hypothetical protein PoB_001437200 [Plakobranchus ocellatus]|uniref:Uncharacterized protein n=1 Tax=Plakobranchus ocellatus TaxID=259542 RepID=A0AAV3Z004_9GAST|nr:hypothetical protein PoB_001437200 [Plakobranchus ocellatus]
MVASANLTKEEKEFPKSSQMDVDDEENTEEATENDVDERTSPSTSTASLSALEDVHMTPLLCPTMSAPLSAIDSHRNVSEYYWKMLESIF